MELHRAGWESQLEDLGTEMSLSLDFFIYKTAVLYLFGRGVERPK